MTNPKPGPIIFFINGKKHIKNVEQLSAFLNRQDLVLITDVPSFTSSKIIFLDSYKCIEDIRPSLIVMFMAYPYEKRLWFMEYSLREDIPCIGIEEVNQLSLNNGRVNHYFTPLDGLAVASQNEQVMLEEIPVPYVENIRVTGWGFSEEVGQSQKEENKSVVLFLSPLQEIDIVSVETRAVREKLLNLMHQFIKLGYSVSIKPHPMEPREHLEKQLKTLGLDKIRIIDELNAADAIRQHEIVVNRGNSQTCIEALCQKKKLLIYPLGTKTIFDGYANVLSEPSELEQKLNFFNSDRYFTQIGRIVSAHVPFDKETALQNIANFINTAKLLRINKREKALHLSLLYFIRGRKRESMELTTFLPKNEAGAICSFYKRPYSPKRFVNLVSMFEKDVFVRFYLSKIYLDHLVRIRRLIRSFFICDLKWIELPDEEFVPFFWAGTREVFAKIYKKL